MSLQKNILSHFFLVLLYQKHLVTKNLNNNLKISQYLDVVPTIIM